MTPNVPFAEGVAAAQAGRPVAECPYDCTAQGGAAKAWAEGWAASIVAQFESARTAQGAAAAAPFHVKLQWHQGWTWTERWAVRALYGAVPLKVAADVIGRTSGAVHRAYHRSEGVA